MNLANVDRLIATLERLEASGHAFRFDMRAYYRTASGSEPWTLVRVPRKERVVDPKDCGTAACLAGWCQLIGARTPEEVAMHARDFAAPWLGLPEEEADSLFLGYWSHHYVDLAEITLPEALAHLRELRAAAVLERYR